MFTAIFADAWHAAHMAYEASEKAKHAQAHGDAAGAELFWLVALVFVLVAVAYLVNDHMKEREKERTQKAIEEGWRRNMERSERGQSIHPLGD